MAGQGAGKGGEREARRAFGMKRRAGQVLKVERGEEGEGGGEEESGEQQGEEQDEEQGML